MAQNIVIMEKCKNKLESEFYLHMTKKPGITKNVLIHQVESQTYEKTLLSQTNFDENLSKGHTAPAKLTVKDHYTFDFLKLGDEYSDRQLEQTVLAKAELFLTESDVDA